MIKTVRFKKYFLGIVSIILTFLPALIFYIKGWICGNSYSKTVLGITFTITLILTLLSVIMKFKCRTMLWILLIGIYIALGNIKTVLIVLTACSGLDEFVVTPLYKYYSEELSNRITYDKICKERGE